MRKALTLLVLLLALVAGGVGGAWAVGLIGQTRMEGFFGPVFDGDGQTIFYVRRVTEGYHWGLGWQMFTPPASVHITDDQVELRRLDLSSGADEVLIRWAATPAVGQTIQTYRPGLFASFTAGIDYREGPLRYRLSLTIPQQPQSRQFVVEGHWPTEQTAAPDWQDGNPGINISDADATLKDGQEVIALQDSRLFPPAVMVLDHHQKSAKPVIAAFDFASLYPDGLSYSALAPQSHQDSILRIREITRLREELETRFLAEGMSPAEAALATIDALEDLGHYPKSPRLTATAAKPEDAALPVFVLSEVEIQSGIFEDIRKAIAEPGEEIRKSMGGYVIYQGYDTSRAINEHLAKGAAPFRVALNGQVWRIDYIAGDR